MINLQSMFTYPRIDVYRNRNAVTAASAPFAPFAESDLTCRSTNAANCGHSDSEYEVTCAGFGFNK